MLRILKPQKNVCVDNYHLKVHAKTVMPSVQVDSSPLPSPSFMSSLISFFFPNLISSHLLLLHTCILITSSNSNLLCCKLIHDCISPLKIFIYALAFHSTAFLNRSRKRRSWKVKFISTVITCQPCINGLMETYELGGRELLENGIAHTNSNGRWVVYGYRNYSNSTYV